MSITEPYSPALAADLRELAKVIGLPYKALMALRACGALSYPVTDKEYTLLTGLLNSLGKTGIIRILVSRRSVAEREMILMGCDKNRIEREALLYVIRHRLEHDGRRPKVYLDYVTFINEFAKRFPNGFRRINNVKLRNIKRQANTIINNAKKEGKIERLLDALRMGHDADRIINRRRKDDRTLRKAARLDAAEQAIRAVEEKKARDAFDYLSGYRDKS